MFNSYERFLRLLLAIAIVVSFFSVFANLTAFAGSSRTFDDDRHDDKHHRTAFSLGPDGEALENGNTLLVAVMLNNISGRDAFDVKIKSIHLHSAPLLTSTAFPLLLGEIAADQSAKIQANFNSNQLTEGQQYLLVVRGSYRPRNDDMEKKEHEGRKDDGEHDGEHERGDEGERREFTLRTMISLPPLAPGSGTLTPISIGSAKVSGGTFPGHQLPDFDNDVNTSRWTIPTGSFVPGVPTPTGTGTMLAPFGDPPGVTFNVNNGLGLTSGPFNGTASGVAEPSGATGGGVVFVTANWTAAYSADGVNFTQLDPTTIFPNDAVGFCCDQIVQYVPSINRFIWLLQGSGNRIAVASPTDILNSGGTAWTYWNLTPDVFGQPGISFDYPDLSVGNNFLYMSWNAGVGCSGCDWGHQVARTRLSDLAAGGSITIEFTDPKDGRMAWGAHLSQDTGDEIFWAGQNSNSSMRVFSLQEGSGTYFWRDIGVSSWATSGISSTAPDGQDWLTKLRDFPGGAVIGATRFSNQVWFAWSAGTDNNFQQPHIEMVTLDRSNNFNKSQQVQIWNNSYAFAYPALATNACTGEVGLSLEYGGNGNYENHVVGFWGDFVVYITTDTNVGTTRYGDYVTIRQDPTAGNGAFFDAFGYGLETPTPPQNGTQTDVRYVQFGRGGACQIN
jgi:hypothetical protein